MKPIQNRNNNTYAPCKGRYFDVFPTPMFHGQVDLNHEQVSNHCRDIVGRLSKGNVETEYTTYFDHDAREETHNQPWFNSFANQMKDSYIDFIKSQFNFETPFSRHDIHLFAWVSVYNKPHSHEVHNHVKSRISGTYYPFTDGNSMPIKFFNPNINAMFSHGASDSTMTVKDHEQIQYMGTKGAQTDMSFTPETGDFILWPSYMLHCVPQSCLDEEIERISISFNLQHAEDLGSYHHGDDFDYSILDYE